MTSNGTATHRVSTAMLPVSTALLVAEKTGQIPGEAWPALRELLLTAADPQLAVAVGPLRQLLQARQAVATARLELDHGYAAVAAAQGTPTKLSEAAAQLSLLADELSARAQQLADLEG